MGVESVNSDKFRQLDISDGFHADDYDTAKARIKHTYQPSKNFITVEFRMPAIRRQMIPEYYDAIGMTYYHDILHEMKYDKVDNTAFHNRMKSEGLNTIDKIKYRVGDHLITYYFSNTRTLGLLGYDYYMAMLVYLNYPKRNFTRRTPCTKLGSKCTSACIENLEAPVVNWLNDPEPNTATLNKYFFSYISDIHRLMVGYTVEDIKSTENCFAAKEPDYYIINLETKYFKEACWTEKEWFRKIMKDRADCATPIYFLDESQGNTSGIFGEAAVSTLNSANSVSFGGYNGTASLTKYSVKDNENVPDSIKEAYNTNNPSLLWKEDMRSLNVRNSIHKWTYNYWQQIGNSAKDGWWCAWDMSEVIDSGAATAASLGDSGGVVKGQLNQVATMFGWGPSGDSSSTDTEYELLSEKLPDYEYKIIAEEQKGNVAKVFN